MKYTIQTKILAGFILGLMAIGLIGYEVHNQMTDLASSLYEENNRKNNLVVYQKILSSISDAESSVRSYSITNEEEDLELFTKAESNINRYLAVLGKDLKENKDFKYLHDNVSNKFHVMHRMIDLRTKNPTEDLLNKAINEIKQLPEAPSGIQENSGPDSEETDASASIGNKEEELSSSTFNDTESTTETEDNIMADNAAEKEEQKDEKKGFFQRLFSRKKSPDPKEEKSPGPVEKENEDEITSATPSPAQELLQEQATKQKIHVSGKEYITRSLKDFQEEKNLEKAIWQDIMLVLIEEDMRLMDDIRTNISALEALELDNNSRFIAAAARSKDQIISNTKIVGLGAFGIIFILSFIVFHDFKKIHKNRLSLIDEKNKASRLANVKENFLANMSHEIRTPMNAIVGFAELMESTPLNKKQEEYLSTIQQSSSHLMVILNDILDYSKIESGKLTIKKEPFNPKKSIEQVAKSMKADAEKKNLDLKVRISKNVKNNLIGDAVRLQQVLYNLVSNAIKFTDKGSVYIIAKGIRQEDKYYLEVKVKDDGIGIPDDYLERIFENFEQASTHRERKHGGTGLGLAIVKRLVILQKGTIKVDTEMNKGSTFTVTIPYKVGEQKTAESAVTAKKGTKNVRSYQHLSVLAVDDQEYNLELIKIIMKKWGAKIDLVSSGKEAVEAFNKKDYDLVLMDVQMPEMSGLEATRCIRNSGKKNAQEVKIIALTAASTKEETDKCLEAGMNGFLLKPFKQKELREVIDKHTGPVRHESEKNLKVTYDLNQLKVLSNGNKEFVVNMLDVFVKNTRNDLKMLENYIVEKNWKSAGLQAHKMVAPSRHLGIKSLADLLEQIENKGIHEKNVEQIPNLVQETKSIALSATCMLEEEMKKINMEKFKQAS